MLGEQAKFPDSFTITQIFATKSENNISGVVRKGEEKAWKFNDVVALMRIHEVLCNVAQFPQATHRLRQFNEEKEQRGLDALKDLQTNDVLDQQPTFVVHIQYRQNASWQGTIQWVEENKEVRFRSALELIKLMDEAIEGDVWE